MTFDRFVSLASRIIPARAGFTPPDQPHRRPRPDHPRSRGVYIATTTEERAAERIIPARAGFTLHLAGRLEQHEDHPRSRGVYKKDR